MRKFYEIFTNDKLTTLWSKLTWSHYHEVLSLKYVIEYSSDERIICREYIIKNDIN